MPLDDTMRDLNFCDMTPDKTPSTSNGCSGQSKPTFMATNKKFLFSLVVFLILRYVGQRMGENLVNVAGTLLILCLFVCYYTASLRAHIACALFVFAAFLAYDASQQRPQCSRLLLFGAGALLGYSSMIRYLDWIPLAAWIGVVLARRKMFPQLTFFSFVFTLLAPANLLSHTLLSPHPLH